ncbi:MAG: prepilin peptidase [Treponema sp.]|nr:prepilin peptidase [Treponema sp.]
MTNFELAGQILILVILLVFSFIMSRYDLRSLAVPNWPYFVGYILIFLVRIIFYTATVYLNLLSAFILFDLYFAVRLITKNKLGKGDVFFGLFQGLCLAPKVLWICVAVEVLAAFFYAIIRFKTIKGIKFAFIPFMSIGLLTAFLIDWFVI